MKKKETKKEVVTLAAATLASIPTPSHATVSITLDDTAEPLKITALDTIIDASITIAGVWGLYDENGVLLDVAQTKDIASEWSALPGKFTRPKFISMQDNGIDLTKLVGKVIAFEDDLKTRLLIEQAFATEYNAQYWNPQPYTFQYPGIDDPDAIGNTPVVYTFTCEVCNNKYESSTNKYKIKVCPTCESALPGKGDSVVRCKGCNIIFKALNGYVNYCSTCDEKRRTFTCSLCNSDYQYTGDNLNQYQNQGIKVCSECATTLPGGGDHIRRCQSCNYIFKDLKRANYCPTCDDNRRTFKCEICHNDYKYIGEILNQYADKAIKVCPTCETTLPGEGIYILKCQSCNCVFKATSNGFNYCPICDNNRKTFTCEICNNEYKTSYVDKAIKVCPTCDATLPGKGDFIKRCENCDTVFKSIGTRRSYCPTCNIDMSIFTCDICHNEFEHTYLNNYADKAIKVCPTCESTLPNDGKGDCILKCKSCDCVFKGAINTIYCPTCDEIKKTFTCQICHEDFKYTGDNLSQYSHSKYKICPECDAGLPGEGNRFKTCKNCDCFFKISSASVIYCPTCKDNRKTFTCEICHKSYQYSGRRLKKYIETGIRACPECKAINLPGEGDCVLRCKDCNNLFKATSSNGKCPICLDNRKTFNCEICNKTYKYTGTNKNLAYYTKYIVKVCPECDAALPGEGDFYLRCRDCDSLFKGIINNIYSCPTCKDKRATFTCEICHNEYLYTNKKLLAQYIKKNSIKVCPECDDKLPGEGKCLLRCKDCHSPFRATSNNFSCCPTCRENRRIFTCDVCHQEYRYEGKHPGDYAKNEVRACPDCVIILPGKGKTIKKCDVCNTIFKCNNGNPSCPICRENKKIFTCEFCGNKYIYNGDNLNKYTDTGVKVCDSCKMTLPGEGNIIRCCIECNCVFKAKGSERTLCPTCYPSNIFTCTLCHNEYEYTGENLIRYSKTAFKVCPKCVETVLSGEGIFILQCLECDSLFKATSNNFNYCPSCEESKRIFNCEICRSEYRYSRKDYTRYGRTAVKVCSECYKTLSGSGSYVYRCKICNSPFKATHNNTGCCPSCHIFTCEICNHEYTYSRVNKGYYAKGVKVCGDCKKILPGECKVVTRCVKCNTAFRAKSNVTVLCPSCYPSNIFTCDICHSEYEYAKKNTTTLLQYANSKFKICPTCDATLLGSGRCTLKCKSCGCMFKAKGTKNNFCPACDPSKKLATSVIKYLELVDNGWIERDGIITEDIPENEQGDTHCVICDRGFISRYGTTICKHCYRVFTCGCCGKKFINYNLPLKEARYCCRGCGTTINNFARSYKRTINKSRFNNSSIDYTPLNIDIDNIDSIVSDGKSPIAGVWALYDENDNLLDVAQTNNIVAEWLILSSKFARPKFITMRNNGINLDTLKGKVIVLEDDETKRLKIEEDYAIKNNARYWSPQPGTIQMSNNNNNNDNNNNDNDNTSR